MRTAAGGDPLLRRVDGMLWAGVLAGPLAWLVDLEASYVAVPAACRHSREWPLHLLTLALLAVPAAAAGLAIRGRRLAEGSGALPVTMVERARFMSWAGVALSALFGLLVLAMGIAKVVHSPCDGF